MGGWRQAQPVVVSAPSVRAAVGPLKLTEELRLGVTARLPALLNEQGWQIREISAGCARLEGKGMMGVMEELPLLPMIGRGPR